MRGTRLTLLLLLAAAPVAGQFPNETPSRDTIVYGVSAPRWAGHLTAATTNVLIGGLTGGIFQELRGGSFKDGFTRGALGGGFTYAGKATAARRFDGAGLLGRQVAAVGSSIIRNAGEGKATFAQLDLPIGPVFLHVTPRTRDVRASLDAIGAAYVVYGIVEPELAFDVGETLSAGAPVFRTDNKIIAYRPNRSHAGGYTMAGVILQSYVPGWGKPFLERVLGHERVHVEQEDQVFLTLIAPVQQWLFGKLPAGDRIARMVGLNLSTELFGLLTQLFPRHADRPWELEAIYLSR